MTLALLAGVACERVPENAPTLAGFNGTRPELSHVARTADGGIDPDTFCDGAAIVSKGRECDTSFSADVFPLLTAKSPGGCTEGVTCHGNAEVTFGGPLGVNPSDTWDRLVQFKLRNRASEPLPYINLCSADPEQSAITCNLDFGAACGSKMPKDRAEFDAASKQIIEEWLKCGAPNN